MLYYFKVKIDTKYIFKKLKNKYCYHNYIVKGIIFLLALVKFESIVKF